MNQNSMFYQSHLVNASSIHLKMAEIQRARGNEKLARDSEKTALARRISSRNITRDLASDLEFGELAVKTNLFN